MKVGYLHRVESMPSAHWENIIEFAFTGTFQWLECRAIPHVEARLRPCHNFYLRKLSSREKNHCQSEGISGKLWTHAAIIVIRLWVGVG